MTGASFGGVSRPTKEVRLGMTEDQAKALGFVVDPITNTCPYATIPTADVV